MKKILFTDGWMFGLKGEPKKSVILPHDAMQLQERHPDEKSGSGCAYFPGGTYCYEKQWEMPAELEGQKVILYFEGVYRNTTVKVNGQMVGSRHYGYIPFWMDVTEALRPGQVNVIEVEADNSETPNSRWYSGGGIYRPVWIMTGPPVHIKPWDLKVKTLSINPACVEVRVATEAEVSVEILDGAKVIASGKGACQQFKLENAKLWSAEHPELYTCRATVCVDGVAVDVQETSFGIRTVTCSPKGLFVNGQETLLRGGCIHSDNGIIGAASFPEAEFRKVKILKDAGYNALRIAHNPASPALMDACDRLGMYIMDEGWDMWYKRKTKYDYAVHFMEDYEKDIQMMVDSDYNHPSVLMYSIGNEISEPAEAEGVELAGKLVQAFKALDDTRLVTVGCNITILTGSAQGTETFNPDDDGSAGTFEAAHQDAMDSTKFNEIISSMGGGFAAEAAKPEADVATTPLFEKVDLAGYNYADSRYPLDGELHPDRVIVGSETFPHEIYTNWQMIKKYPYVVGDFMWTALDYIGEVGIGAWSYEADAAAFTKPYPWLLGAVGAMDLIGTPTGELYMAQAAWDMLNEAPAIAVSPEVMHPGEVPARGAWRGTDTIPSWSFRGCEGNPVTVEVHSGAAEVELFINGESQGRKPVVKGMAVYACVYEPGIIEAVGYDASGEETGHSMLESAIGELSVRITAEEACPELLDMPDLDAEHAVTYYRIEVVGENGVVESHADRQITFKPEKGTLLGFGSGCPRTLEKFAEGTYSTYYGRALAAVLK